MGVMSMGYQRKLASSSYHPRILSLGAFQRFLEGGVESSQKEPVPPAFSPQVRLNQEKGLQLCCSLPGRG